MKELIKSIPITNSSVVVDIGANEGQEIQALLPTQCQVHSFEPHPMFFKELELKYGSLSNIHLNQCAAWSSNCEQELYFKIDRSVRNGGASILKLKRNISGKYTTKVKCIDIAEYINNLDTQIDLLKINAEGAEYEILNHIFYTNTYKKIEHIYYEDHSEDFPLNTERPRKKTIEFSISGPAIEPLIPKESDPSPPQTNEGKSNEGILQWNDLRKEVLLKYKESNLTLNTWHG